MEHDIIRIRRDQSLELAVRLIIIVFKHKPTHRRKRDRLKILRYGIDLTAGRAFIESDERIKFKFSRTCCTDFVFFHYSNPLLSLYHSNDKMSMQGVDHVSAFVRIVCRNEKDLKTFLSSGPFFVWTHGLCGRK